jgi:hypothetical protein
MDEDFYDDYRDSLLEWGDRCDQAYDEMKQEELDREVDRRLKSSMGINRNLDQQPDAA